MYEPEEGGDDRFVLVLDKGEEGEGNEFTYTEEKATSETCYEGTWSFNDTKTGILFTPAECTKLAMGGAPQFPKIPSGTKWTGMIDTVKGEKAIVLKGHTLVFTPE